MRLREFSSDATDSGLATVLNFLANRAKDSDAPGSMSTQSVINMVKNSGSYFDYDALVNAYENDKSIKNLIKDFDKDTITLKLPGEDEPDSDEINNDEDEGGSFDDDESGSNGEGGIDFDDQDQNAEQENFNDVEQRDTVGDMAKRAMHRRGR